MPTVQCLINILSIIILVVRLIRRWDKWERERVHRSRSGLRSWQRAGATRPSPSCACGGLALPECPHSSPVCCALPNADNRGLVAFGIGAGEKSWVWGVGVSCLPSRSHGALENAKRLTGRAESAGTGHLDPFHAGHASWARLDQVVLGELGSGRLSAVIIPEAMKGWKVSLVALVEWRGGGSLLTS